ncbi:hypothetical protein [Noviherbaspirillum aerium]|uniref:hypothetical protein n=1 Tax=Noviherbaspirillum aerium TaxID=2588497 RepID=UPI00124BCBDD|nr:hypothetical protein [Noviherbaspirillum aerium]
MTGPAAAIMRHDAPSEEMQGQRQAALDLILDHAGQSAPLRFALKRANGFNGVIEVLQFIQALHPHTLFPGVSP